ncbi:MAG: NAD(P)H-quinone oxidoreductase [Pyrinomonadaceae bacterium]
MKAIWFSNPGKDAEITVTDLDDPAVPSGREILIDVKASGLNRADLLQMRGLYPPPPGYSENIPGLEFSGIVAAIGPLAKRFKIGDRVAGITSGGAQSERLLCDERLMFAVPDSIDIISAAGIPEAYITAHDAIVTLGRLKADETLLIHAVGSGVGLAALQIAGLIGARTIGTSRTESKLDMAKAEGLDHAISGEDFGEEVKELGGADVVLDLVGAAYFEENLKVLNPLGRLIAVGLVGGRKAEIDLGLVLSKRLTLRGTVLRSRSIDEKEAAVSSFENDLMPAFSSGLIAPKIDSVYGIDDVEEAYSKLAANGNFGKILLEW